MRNRWLRQETIIADKNADIAWLENIINDQHNEIRNLQAQLIEFTHLLQNTINTMVISLKILHLFNIFFTFQIDTQMKI